VCKGGGPLGRGIVTTPSTSEGASSFVEEEEIEFAPAEEEEEEV